MTIFRSCLLASFASAAALALFCGPIRAEQNAQSFPRITQAKDAKACRQAFAVAKRAFASTAARPADAAPVILPEKKPDFGIVLAPDLHNPDGDAMIVDEAAVTQDNGGRFKAVYLPKAAQGFRFVVTQQKMNWQGDFFGLAVVDAALDADHAADRLADEKKDKAKRVYQDAWQAPWLIRDAQTQEIVAIDTQPPANFLADWIVYRIANGKPELACRIAFRPAAKRAADLLPAGALRELAALLDDVLGVPAQDEGTLQPTARIRVAAAQAWANLALRPWALEEPYNSQKEIAYGLKGWTKRSPVYRARYQRLQALLPKAENELAAYYQTALAKSAQEAVALAKQALPRAVGASFVFGKKGD
ncbi:MAG: hypothetical protein JO000_13700 [Alphaproteobacteria bacterium]|nr:hypothetical protein [Alphaproteobacteria bacterium]